MAFYDHFHSSETSSITGIGRKLLAIQNQYFVELVKRFCPGEHRTLLEIGCGRGFFADQCRKNGLAYEAIEANEKMAAEVAARGFKVHRAFVPPIGLDTKFDAIFMDQVFEHMKDRDQAVALIESCKDHLKREGIVIISSPDVFTARHDFFQDYTHSYPTCMPMLGQIFTNCDLKILHQDYISFFVRGLLPTRILAFLVRIGYGSGLFHLAFGKRAYLAKLSLLPSCVIVGRTN